MKRLLISILLLSTAGMCSAQTLFIHERDIHFDTDEVLLGDILQLDIGPDGEIFISNINDRYAALFDSTGRLIRELDPTPCHPGIQFTPWEAAIGPDRIFLNNSGPWGYLFNRDGTCRGDVDDSYRNLKRITSIPGGRYVGLGLGSERTWMMTVVDGMGRTLESMDLPKGDYPNAEFQSSDIGFDSNGEMAVFVPAFTPVVHVIQDDKIRTIDRDAFLEGHDPIRDFPDNLEFSGMAKAVSLVSGAMTNSGASILSDGRLFLRYRESGELIWIVLDPVEPDEALRMEGLFWVSAVRDDRVYRVRRPESTEVGDIPNPWIEVYRYTGSR